MPNLTYILSLYVFTAQTVVNTVEQCGGTNPFAILLIEQLCWPLQGFCNVLIFLRPRISSIQKRYPQLSYMQVLYFATFAYDNETRRQLVLDKVRRKSQQSQQRDSNNQTRQLPQCAMGQSSMTSHPSAAESKVSGVEILTSIGEGVEK